MPWPFKRSKKGPSFVGIATDGLYDIHCHLFPGFDDGARNMDDTVAMLDGLESLGYVCVAATSHFSRRDMIPNLKTQTGLIEEISQKRGHSEPEILTGAEIFFDDRFSSDEEMGTLPRIGKGRAYLVEFGFHEGGVPAGIEEAVSKLHDSGLTLVLAHPERFVDFLRDRSRFEAFYQAGMLMQVDLLSFVGKHGKAVKMLAQFLFDKGVIDFVASDLHRPSELDSLEQALEDLAKMDQDEFIRLASINPRHLLEGRPDQVIRNA
jgi:protein-tyrosine phosphatase